MIPRKQYELAVRNTLRRVPVAALLGPRQCGKTTLARLVARGPSTTYLDLESPQDDAKLQSPLLFLEPLSGLVVIDEIQRRPDLFPVLRVLADRAPRRARFLILGSASPHLMNQASESLAGRIHFIELTGFGVDEVGPDHTDRLWLRGGFPRSYLARSNGESMEWREDFIRTFLERDIPGLGLSIPAPALRRFWTMLAHYHGQIWNASELGRSLGLSDNTLRRYLDLLTQTFMIRQLQPWFENIGKRQVKAPKVYFRDSGLLHLLLMLPDSTSLWGHPKVGASWEGYMLEQVLRALAAPEAYFWATHSGAEIDLVLRARGRAYGVEFKCSESPRLTRSLLSAIEDLRLERVWVVHPGKSAFPIHEKVTALPAAQIATLAGEIH